MNNSLSIILGILESWLSPDYPNKCVNVPGYNIIRTDRINRGGGVACYLKEEYKFSLLISSVSNFIE